MEHTTQIEKLCNTIYARDMYGKLRVPPSAKTFEDYLRDNRLIHVLPAYRKEYDVFENHIIRAIQLLNKLIGEQKYIMIKTLSSYPHTTSDIDIVVKTRELASDIRAKLAKQEPFPVPIDINHEVSWTDSEEVSQSFIWAHLEERTLHGHTVLVPDATLDTFIRIGHIPFELAEIRLGELMHIFETSRTIDVSVLEQEAHHMKWPQTFARMKRMIDALHKGMYGEYLFPDDNRYVARVIHDLSFPYRLTYGELLQAVVEKRSWKKIKGARYIIRDRFPWLKNIIS